jgi:hypothetical protein
VTKNSARWHVVVNEDGDGGTTFTYRSASGSTTSNPQEVGRVDIEYVAKTKAGKVELKSSASINDAIGGDGQRGGNDSDLDAIDDTIEVVVGQTKTVNVMDNDRWNLDLGDATVQVVSNGGFVGQINTGANLGDVSVTGPAPDCLGQDTAPNCAPGITHQACTGIPPKPVVSASVTKTMTVTTGTASASATKTKSRKVVVHQMKKTAKAKHKGKVYKVSHTGKIVVKFSRSATADATVTTGTATRTVTSSCAAETQDAAQACADAKAAAEKRALAKKIAKVS